MTEETNWLLRTTQFHTVFLCLYVADPATFLAPKSVLGTLFSSENSSFSDEKKLIILSFDIVNIKILTLNVLFKTTCAPLTTFSEAGTFISDAVTWDLKNLCVMYIWQLKLSLF